MTWPARVPVMKIQTQMRDEVACSPEVDDEDLPLESETGMDVLRTATSQKGALW